MNTTIKYILTFAAGAGVGAAASWILLKNKFEKFAQEQIDSVKETYRGGKKADIHIADEHGDLKPEEPKKADEPDISIADYARQLRDYGYTNYSDISGKKEGENKTMGDKPYVIPPEEFGDFDEYERITLIYYADQVLTDEDNELVEDVDDVVGLESLNHFGEYEDDSVHVRNDRLKCDYEILYDPRDYADIVKKIPHPREDE